MDVRYINPFISAVKNVFKTMLETDLLISKPRLAEENVLSGDVSAVIGFSGDAVGCVVLCFPMSSAIKTASRFSGTEMTAAHEDFSDALGELTNMVVGQAKAQFNGLAVTVSLPNVVIGQKLGRQQLKTTHRLSIPCDSSLGRFSVEVAMVAKRQEGASTQTQVAVASADSGG